MSKTIDVENYEGTSEIFKTVYGEDMMNNVKVQQGKALEEMNLSNSTSPGGIKVGEDARLSVFAKEKVYESDWTNTTLNLLEYWVKKFEESAAKHADAARGCRKKFRMISIPTIFIGTVGTALSFFSAGDTCTGEGDDENLKYAVAAFTSAVTILGGVSTLYSFSTKMAQNISAAGGYTNLARRSNLQVRLPNHLRGSCEATLVDVSAEFANLTNTSPLL